MCLHTSREFATFLTNHIDQSMMDSKAITDYEKQRLVEEEEEEFSPLSTSRQPSTFREHLFRYVLPCILLLLSVSILFRKVFVCHHQYRAGKYLPGYNDEVLVQSSENITKVALEAHIMSKCPDAKACLEQLVVPAMAEVSELVDFKLSYIGTLDPNSDEVQCMHGPTECLGNIIQLCAAHEYPSPIIYLGFANCMTSQYQNIPNRDLVEGCALEHGIDFQKLNACISDERKGVQLLRQSVQHSQDVHVSTSCTVRLEGKVRCVRDGGKWKDCPGGSDVSDLVGDIMALYLDKNIL